MERSSARLKVFAILVAIMFAALSTRLWFLQVLATEVYAQEAQNNSVRTAKTDALRGEIWTSDQFAKEQADSPKSPASKSSNSTAAPTSAAACCCSIQAISRSTPRRPRRSSAHFRVPT